MLLNTRDIQLMNAFEAITRARAVDCFEAEDSINFLIHEGDLGKAIGKGGENIAKARQRLGKRIVVFEDSADPREFVRNACAPLKVSPIIDGTSVRIDAPRGKRDEISGKQIRIIKELVKRKLKASNVEFVFV